MARDRAQIKVSNHFLYSSEWPRVLPSIFKAIGFQFLRLTRVDICGDFEYFANGRLPLRFVQDYLSKPKASRPSFIRKASNKFRAFGVRKTSGVLFETLSWGTRDSAVQVNLYNKTIELAEKTDKPWIREKWREAGLPADFESSRYVWRVEFSINCSAKYLFQHDGLVRDIMLSDVESAGRLQAMWHPLVSQFFEFRLLTAADVRARRRVKDLQPVVLFSDVDAASFRFRSFVPSIKASGRTEKILMNKLQTLLDSETLTPNEAENLRGVLSVLGGVYQSKAARAAGQLTADDFLRSFCCQSEKTHNWPSAERHARDVSRLVSMLRTGKRDELQAIDGHLCEWDANMTALESTLRELADILPIDEV